MDGRCLPLRAAVVGWRKACERAGRRAVGERYDLGVARAVGCFDERGYSAR